MFVFVWSKLFSDTWSVEYKVLLCENDRNTPIIIASWSLIIWAPSSEFVSSSIPSWQILTAHPQPFRKARDLAFCLKVPIDPLLVWESSEGSGEAARMRRLAWTFAARIGSKYQIRLTRSIYSCCYDVIDISCNKILLWSWFYAWSRVTVYMVNFCHHYSFSGPTLVAGGILQIRIFRVIFPFFSIHFVSFLSENKYGWFRHLRHTVWLGIHTRIFSNIGYFRSYQRISVSIWINAKGR